LAERARTAGRVEWVRAVAGARHNRRLGELSDREWEAAVGVLVTTGRWEQLWRLALVAPPLWGARMLRELGQRSWQPSAEADRAGRDELTTLARACAADVPVGGLLDEEAAVLEGHSAAVGCLAVTPDGGLLASGGDGLDGTVRLWRLPSGAPAGTLTGHKGDVRCLAVTPDGGLLASGGRDGTVRLWRSSLRAASRTPVGDLDPADVQRLLHATNDQPAAAAERSWALLIAALVSWRRRHDIELADAGLADPAGASDIELEG